jgi:hypothetical protein
MSDNVTWLSITEYSSSKGISISTIRRRIKSGKAIFKFENGKYLIRHDHPQNDLSGEDLEMKLKIQRLETQIVELQNENMELKMLVQIYESKGSAPSDQPPALPTFSK